MISSNTNATLASAGVAGAAVVIVSWALSLAHVTVPADVQDAGIAILTWLASQVFHQKPGAPQA